MKIKLLANGVFYELKKKIQRMFNCIYIKGEELIVNENLHFFFFIQS